MRVFRRRPVAGLFAPVLVLTLASCTSGTSGDTAGERARSSPATTVSAATTSGPSKAAQMVCTAEARKRIAEATRMRTTAAPTSTWSDQEFRCRYPFGADVLVLSVKELPDAAATTAYFTSMRDSTPRPVALRGLGEAAFAGADGPVVTRKDFKVLVVDVSGMSTMVGKPPRARAQVAFVVAMVIMGCWTSG